ncbi:MAG: MobV family relaxase [Proteiniphilum sp.]|uniref:MobV family relaxase n=1 Tax=Proteiniphilum sp. TaxID=1926877 RepID=UPI002ABCF598|nr:MobV family relaxase [Proteiniphilum sp.]MDY9918100.1 MobV family relaxase [Proteiniphilum sp.]
MPDIQTSGTDSAMSAHIERTIAPKNADSKRTHLNRELIAFPDGVRNRTQAIQHRLDNAGLQRKIGKNQVRAIRVLLTGSNEDMKRIEAEGRLGDWCDDNLEWLRKTYGKENIVSAVLHLDETTPHIHATLVPIVTTERRKKKSETQVKKNYRKKNPNAPRLSADDVMTRAKLKAYQNSYPEAMAKYGLQRGIEGSEARHIGTSQYYRDLVSQNENLKVNIGELLEKQATAKKKLSQVKSEASKEKFKKVKAEMGANLMDGVNSLFIGSKTKRQQAEIEELKSENATLKDENSSLKTQLQTLQKEYKTATDKLQAELKKIYDLFPNLRELLSIENLCQQVGFAKETIQRLLRGGKVSFSERLFSSEHKRRFATENSIAQIVKIPDKPGKLRLTIDGVEITEWFRLKYREFQRSIGIDWAERSVGRGRKI